MGDLWAGGGRWRLGSRRLALAETPLCRVAQMCFMSKTNWLPAKRPILDTVGPSNPPPACGAGVRLPSGRGDVKALDGEDGDGILHVQESVARRSEV